jgi:small subunit ribosomal protein S24e
MKILVLEDKKNPLLERREVRFEVESKITPKRTAVKDELSKQIKAKVELMVLGKLSQMSGTNVSVGYVKIYDSKESLDKIEAEYMKKRNEKKEEPKAEEPAPTPAAEPSTEEAEVAAPEAAAEPSTEEAEVAAPEAAPVEEESESTPVEKPEEKEENNG